MPDNGHYLRRVPPQHRRIKFLRWLTAILDPFLDAERLVASFDYEFDLDNAVGAQLDVTGDIVGRKRLLDFEPSDGSSPLLDDRLYRILQKAKISINHWDGTIPGALALWEILFPEYQLVIFDNQDMSIDMVVVGLVTELEKELMLRGYLAPKPQGVRINYNFATEIPFETCWMNVGGSIWPCIMTTTLPQYHPPYDFNATIGIAGAAWSVTATNIPQYIPCQPLRDDLNVGVTVNTVLQTSLPQILI